MTELLRLWAGEIAELLPDVASGTLHNWTTGSSGGVVFITGTPNAWSDLPIANARSQSLALEEYARLTELLRLMLRGQPEDQREAFQENVARVQRLLEREESPFDTPQEALENARTALAEQIGQIDRLFSSSDGDTLLIPDTNALYWNTALETWRAPWNSRFRMVLTPQVISELDEHKEGPPSSSRQQKAARLVRQLSEYRRRGKLTAGVPLTSGVSTIMAIAIEPHVSESLSWLDPSSADDRIIASTIEVIRRNVRSRVVAVTRDLNLQNKLELARIPFVAPGDLVAKA